MVKYLVLMATAILVCENSIACSTCMVGDPTQSLMGAEKPFANRIRMSIDYLTRREEIGREGVNRKTIDEQRLSLNLAYAPNRRWMFGMSLPYVDRQLDNFNLADQSVTALGDISISAKSFWQEDESFQRHMYGFLGGIKFGTASEEKDDQGLELDFDVQPGQGADVVNAGLWYAHFRYPYLFYSSASYHVASEGFQDFQAGDALTLNATLQYAIDQDFSWYLGAESRTSRADEFDGIEDPDSGGSILFLTPGFIYTLQPDLLLNAVYKYPLIEALDGDHEETAIFSIGITYDFPHH